MVAPRVLRRRRMWSVAAALMAAGGVLAAAVVVRHVMHSGGDVGQRLTPGQPVSVHLSWTDRKMVWVRETGQRIPDVMCTPSRVDGQMTRDVVVEAMTFDRVELDVEGERWRGLLVIDAYPPGQYEVTCTAAGTNAQPMLSIGDPPRSYARRDPAGGGLTSWDLIIIGVVGGGVLAVILSIRSAVVAFRRRSGRRPT